MLEDSHIVPPVTGTGVTKASCWEGNGFIWGQMAHSHCLEHCDSHPGLCALICQARVQDRRESSSYVFNLVTSGFIPLTFIKYFFIVRLGYISGTTCNFFPQKI